MTELTSFLTLRSAEVEKLYEARRLIDVEIASFAAVRCDEAAFDGIDALIRRQDDARIEPARYREVDTAFHYRLAELAGNEYLSRASQSLNVLGHEF